MFLKINRFRESLIIDWLRYNINILILLLFNLIERLKNKKKETNKKKIFKDKI